jgi:TRAP-type C4-dicarboxylate transport system substrate-binding protein
MFRKITFFLSVVAGMTFAAGVAHAQAVTLKLASFDSPQSPPLVQAIIPWAKDVNQASAGTLNIEIFPGGTLGRNPLQQFKLIQDGVVDMAWIIAGYTPGRFDETEVVELPFVINDAREAAIALWRMHARGLLSGFDDLKLLGIASTGIFNLHSRTPIKSLGEVVGKKIRTPTGVGAKTLQALGAVPVQIGAPQIGESLARGVIDASLNDWGLVQTFRLDEVVNNHVMLPMGAATVMVPMLKSKYDSLPPQAKAALDKYSGEPFSLRIAAAMDVSAKENIDRVAKAGKGLMYTPNPSEQAAWRKATEPVVDAWRKAKPANDRAYLEITEELRKIRAGR